MASDPAIFNIIDWSHRTAPEVTDPNILIGSVEPPLSALGIRGFAYLKVGIQRPILLYSTYSSSWNSRYTSSDIDFSDPYIELAKNTLIPVLWDLEATNDAHTRFCKLALAYGIPPRGMTTGLRDPNGNDVYFSVSSNMRAIDWKRKMKGNSLILQMVGAAFHAAVSRLCPSPKIKLSPRERDTLSWAAQGKTAWETSKILGISEGTVNQYLHASRRKLKVSSKTQCVAYAQELGLLTRQHMNWQR